MADPPPRRGVPRPRLRRAHRAVLLEQAGRAGLERLGTLDLEDPHHVVDLVRKRIDERSFAAWERLSTAGDQRSPSEMYGFVRREMLAAEREKVLEVRSTGTVPGDIVAEVLHMLDVEESMIDTSSEKVEAFRTAGLRLAHAQDCADLTVEQWTQEVNNGEAPAEQYFVMKNLAARIDELVAAKG